MHFAPLRHEGLWVAKAAQHNCGLTKDHWTCCRSQRQDVHTSSAAWEP